LDVPQVKSPNRRKGAAKGDAIRLRTTILIPEKVHTMGVTLAKGQRRSFSNFVATLIEQAEAVNGNDGKEHAHG
jgi:hypothetical protein